MSLRKGTEKIRKISLARNGSCYTILHSWYAVLLLSHLGSIRGRCPNDKRSECGPMHPHAWERQFKISFTLKDSLRRIKECPYSWCSVTWRYLFWLCLMSQAPELPYLRPRWPRMTPLCGQHPLSCSLLEVTSALHCLLSMLQIAQQRDKPI